MQHPTHCPYCDHAIPTAVPLCDHCGCQLSSAGLPTQKLVLHHQYSWPIKLIVCVCLVSLGLGLYHLSINSVDSTTGAHQGRIALISQTRKGRIISIRNADGPEVRSLESIPSGVNSLSVSPDGKRIAFSTYQDGHSEIYLVNSDGSGLTRLSDPSTFSREPSWSPDGQHIAFVSGRDANSEIYVMNVNGSEPQRLTTNVTNEDSPSWSPDGQRIAFMCERSGSESICTMNSDGTNEQILTSGVTPTWAPDGQRIAFVSIAGSGNDANIYSIDVDGSNLIQLTRNTYDIHPAWSPDSKWISFASDRDGNWEIYTMRADGSAQTRLTFTSEEEGNPVWTNSLYEIQ